MVTIDPDKSKVLEFKVNVVGNLSDPIARLVMPLGENLNLSILGEIHDNSIQVVIPKLRQFYENLQNGGAQLEVIIDGNVFVPWEDTIEFKEERKVVVESFSEKTTKKQPSVQVGAALINETEMKTPIKPLQTNKKYKFNISDDYL
jgi:hypothetical protein